jgi:hypothetical protein
MNQRNRREATDEIVGLAFKRSLFIVSIAGVLIIAATLVYKAQQEEEKLVEAPPASPVSTGVDTPFPVVNFTDITRAAGITFSHTNGASGEKLLPETMGSGAAFFDYDNDGDQDLLLINSAHWSHQAALDEEQPMMRLYRNDGQGGFTNVTAGSGLDVSLYGMGFAVGDYDNDGDADVFITALGLNHLFRNDAGQFHDITTAAGVGGTADAWSTSVGFVDIDNDGDLDLFVANYVRLSRETYFIVNFQVTGICREYGPP